MAKMEEKVDKDYENKSYWERVRDFNLSRTPFWISILWELVATIGPWLAIWLTIGPDFAGKGFNFFEGDLIQGWSDNGIGFVALISCMYLIWAMGIATLTWALKWQKSDTFTYTLAFAVVGFMIIMNGCWMYDWTNGGKKENQGVRVIVDFIICLFSMLFAMFVGVIITTFARNQNYKVEEEDEAILLAYQRGEEVPTKKQLRLERARINKEKREAEAKELDLLKASIDAKIEQDFIEEQKKREEEMDLTKEQKRELKKKRKAEAKKQRMFEKKNKHSDSKEIHGLD